MNTRFRAAPRVPACDSPRLMPQSGSMPSAAHAVHLPPFLRCTAHPCRCTVKLYKNITVLGRRQPRNCCYRWALLETGPRNLTGPKCHRDDQPGRKRRKTASGRARAGLQTRAFALVGNCALSTRSESASTDAWPWFKFSGCHLGQSCMNILSEHALLGEAGLWTEIVEAAPHGLRQIIKPPILPEFYLQVVGDQSLSIPGITTAE
jgi:hypothetical protein